MVNFLNHHTCEAINSASIEAQDDWWNGNWDKHHLGWLVAGVMASITLFISLITITMHACNYYRPKEQRQILRILFMPPVYAIVSFFSYRFFREYTYYEIAVIAYESLVVAAFLYLLLQYVGEEEAAQRAVLMEKGKRTIPFPFCCVRYRPSKPYFLYALRFSVLQYSFLRPALSIIGIVTQAYGVLCPTAYSIYFAAVYLDAVDFVSISVALYGLIVFYTLVKDQLQGRKPLAKFASIKLIVFFTFYQSFVFDVLQSHGVIKATQYWTATNVADGLNALATSCEMVIFSALMMWAFNWREYTKFRKEGMPLTNPLFALWQCFNYWDFLKDLGLGIAFAFRYCLGRPGTHASDGERGGFDINAAFNPPDNSSRRHKNFLDNTSQSNSQLYTSNSPETLRSQLPPPFMRERSSHGYVSRSQGPFPPNLSTAQKSSPSNTDSSVQYQAQSVDRNLPDVEQGGNVGNNKRNFA